MEISINILAAKEDEARTFTMGLSSFLNRISSYVLDAESLHWNQDTEPEMIEAAIADKRGYAYTLTFTTVLQRFATEHKYVIEARPNQHEWILVPVDVIAGVAEKSNRRPSIRIVNITSDGEFDILEKDKDVVYLFGEWTSSAIYAIQEMTVLPVYTLMAAQKISEATTTLLEWAGDSLEISAKGTVVY